MPQRRHFPHFDGLRAIAVLAVVLVHSSIYAGVARPGSAMLPYIERLDVAVPVFLIISGFLLYRPFAVARLEGKPMPSLGLYAWQRGARIIPGYWVALTISALWLTGLPDVLRPSGILTFYGFGQIYSSATMSHGIPQAWTLCVEVAFYVCLPVWVLALRRVGAGEPRRWMRRELSMLAALGAASLAYNVLVLYSDAAGPLIPTLTPLLTALPGYMDQFAVGMALAVLSVGWEARGRLPRTLTWLDRWPGIAWLVALAVFLYAVKGSGLARHAAGGFTHTQYLVRHLLYTLIALGLVMPAAFGDVSRGLVRRFLALRPLAYLGIVSYGLYLYHALVLAKLYAWGWGSVHLVHPYVSWLLGCLAATLIPASLSWYLLERPALRLRGRLLRRRAAAAGAGASAPAAGRAPRSAGEPDAPSPARSERL